MPYTSSVAARISQLGTTVVDFNLIDSNGAMPPVRTSYKWKKLNPTGSELTTARSELIARYTQAYQDDQQQKANVAAFREKLSNYLDTKIANAQEDYLEQVESSNLNNAQKEIARRVTIDWRLG